MSRAAYRALLFPRLPSNKANKGDVFESSPIRYNSASFVLQCYEVIDLSMNDISLSLN